MSEFFKVYIYIYIISRPCALCVACARRGGAAWPAGCLCCDGDGDDMRGTSEFRGTIAFAPTRRAAKTTHKKEAARSCAAQAQVPQLLASLYLASLLALRLKATFRHVAPWLRMRCARLCMRRLRHCSIVPVPICCILGPRKYSLARASVKAPTARTPVRARCRRLTSACLA